MEEDVVEETKKTKIDTPTPQGKKASDLIGDLVTLVSTYAKSVEQAQTKLGSASEEAWAQYYKSNKEIATKTARAWIDSYAAYLDAYQKLPEQPDEVALESVRNAWSAHVLACGYTPDIAEVGREAYQKLYDSLHEANRTAAESIGAASKGCFENHHTVLAAHGLTNLDPTAVQFVTHQIAAINTSAARAT